MFWKVEVLLGLLSNDDRKIDKITGVGVILSEVLYRMTLISNA